MDDQIEERPGRAQSLFPALLRFWRNQRGLSQIDLSLTADVSARHISFLETGRSRPSIEMVMLLAETLDLRLRDRNEMLRGAGFRAVFPEPTVDEVLAGPLGDTVDAMLKHHEPYPMFVLDHCYRVVRANSGAVGILALVGVQEWANTNLLQVLFSDGARSTLQNWGDVAGEILRRLQRQCLQQPNDEELADLLAMLLSAPEIPSQWRARAALESSDPMIPIRARVGAHDISLLATVTTFSAPNNVTLDELQIESYLPMDQSTREFFESVLPASPIQH